LVSPTAVPFTSIGLGQTTFQITTSVGRALQTYDLKRGLNLVFVTRPQTPCEITASLAWKNTLLAAWGDQKNQGIWGFRRGRKIAELEIPRDHSQNIRALRIFGSWIVGVCYDDILVWKADSLEFYTSLKCTAGTSFSGSIACVPTLLNKILLGKDDGSVEIWNVASAKLVYTIVPESADVGAVTALEPAQALGLVAIGYANGTVVIHDIHSDEQVMQFFAGNDNQRSFPITSISFRSDGQGAGDDGRKAGVMATASTQSGDVTMWDLNNGGRKAGVLRGAHASSMQGAPGGITRIEFLPGQAVLVSTGLDNHLKTWIFDETPFSAIPRPLHSRGGHGGSVTRLDFLPSASDGSDMSGKWLLASSKDRSLWAWSLRRDGQSTELSQGAIKKKARKQGIMSSAGRDSIEALKAPPITDMVCSLNRDGGMGTLPGKLPIWQSANSKGHSKGDAETSSMTGWESVITAHAGDSKARTWFFGRKRAGRWAFETSDKSEVTSVGISPCGTFALLGSKGGSIDSYNLQSGMSRQKFPAPLTPQQVKQNKINSINNGSHDASLHSSSNEKHTDAVTGLMLDNFNRTLISCGRDGKMKFWDFRTGHLQHELNWSLSLGVTINGMKLHRSSDLAAFSCSDGALRVIDITTRKIVRELRVQKSDSIDSTQPVCSSFTFSQDGRWILAAFSRFVATWDLPTGHLIDLFCLPAGCNSLSFSPTGEYLATSTNNSVGVDIWTNRTLYTIMSTRHLSNEHVSLILSSDTAIQLPTASGENAVIIDGEDVQPDGTDADENFVNPADDIIDPDTVANDLVSLSIVPRSRWQNLLHLETIRARNKPIAPPKKPEKAPFFLPSTLSSQQKPLALSNGSSTTEQDPSTELAKIEQERSRIMKMDRSLTKSVTTRILQSGDSKAFISQFKTLNPAEADVELRSLSSSSSNGLNEYVLFIDALCDMLDSKRDFELGQAWMSVFLNIHSDIVVEDVDVRNAVIRWKDKLVVEKARVQEMVEYCRGMVGYLRAGRV